MDKNGAQTAQNPAEIRYGGICYQRVVFGIHPLYFRKHADAYCGFRTDCPCHHDRRTDDFPIALSISTKIAPPLFKTQMVALNFLAFSLGFTLGGVLFEKCYQAGDEIGFYRLLFYIGAATGFLLLLLVPKLNKMLEGTD